jgi:hypothetical protein
VSDVPLLFQEGQMTKFSTQKLAKVCQKKSKRDSNRKSKKAELAEKNISVADAEEQVNGTLVKSVSSTIRHFKNHTFARLLNGEDFFWGQSPAKDDALTIIFRLFLHLPQNIAVMTPNI